MFRLKVHLIIDTAAIRLSIRDSHAKCGLYVRNPRCLTGIRVQSFSHVVRITLEFPERIVDFDPPTN
jgi:hypothetical protein